MKALLRFKRLSHMHASSPIAVQDVRMAVAQANYELVYRPKYSPDMAWIELVIADVSRRMRTTASHVHWCSADDGWCSGRFHHSVSASMLQVKAFLRQHSHRMHITEDNLPLWVELAMKSIGPFRNHMLHCGYYTLQAQDEFWRCWPLELVVCEVVTG